MEWVDELWNIYSLLLLNLLLNSCISYRRCMRCPKDYTWSNKSSEICIWRRRVYSRKVQCLLYFFWWRWRDDSNLSRTEHMEFFTKLCMWVKFIIGKIKDRVTSSKCVTYLCADPESQRCVSRAPTGYVSGVVSVVGWTFSNWGKFSAELESLFGLSFVCGNQ